jgi:hypothetical protein
MKSMKAVTLLALWTNRSWRQRDRNALGGTTPLWPRGDELLV